MTYTINVHFTDYRFATDGETTDRTFAENISFDRVFPCIKTLANFWYNDCHNHLNYDAVTHTFTFTAICPAGTPCEMF
jgi:hypothetical protein